MSVNTCKVSGRRQVRYQSLDELLADAERMATQPHRTLGNWSYGQILGHLAETCHMSIDGNRMKVPWPLRLIGRLLRNRVLTKPMSAGFKLPRRMAAALVPGDMPTADGLAALRRGIERLRTETRRAPHLVFGPYTAAEWDQLHLRHAELHMSFVVPADSTSP
jgi:hypothetical protein